MGVWPRTDRQTHRQTHRRAWPQYILRRLRLTQNVIIQNSAALQCNNCWGLIAWIKVLRPTWHKIGHFRDVPKPISWLGMEKQNPTQQKNTFTNQKISTTTQNKHKKQKPGLVTTYDIWPGNGEGLFWFRRFINWSLSYLLRHLSTYLQPQDLHEATADENSIKISHHTIQSDTHYHVKCFTVLSLQLCVTITFPNFSRYQVLWLYFTEKSIIFTWKIYPVFFASRIIEIEIGSFLTELLQKNKGAHVLWSSSYNLKRVYILLLIGQGHSNSSDHGHTSSRSTYCQLDQTRLPMSCNSNTLKSQSYLNRCHVGIVMYV